MANRLHVRSAQKLIELVQIVAWSDILCDQIRNDEIELHGYNFIVNNYRSLLLHPQS